MKRSVDLAAAVLAFLSVIQFTPADDLAPNIFIRVHNPHGGDRKVNLVQSEWRKI
jgi:hypothetical protein